MSIIRRLLPLERGTLGQHLLALGPSDRQRRFQTAMSDMALLAHVERIDFVQTHVIGWFEDGMLRGAAEVAFDRLLLPRVAEIGLTVQAAQQKQGVGTELARRGVILARNRGARRLILLCLRENLGMQRIARRLSGLLSYEQGAVEAHIRLERATPWSLWLEAFDEMGAAMVSASGMAVAR
jgi:RimJ/RimL family protein N-acetyltransferase